MSVVGARGGTEAIPFFTAAFKARGVLTGAGTPKTADGVVDAVLHGGGRLRRRGDDRGFARLPPGPPMPTPGSLTLPAAAGGRRTGVQIGH